MLGLKKGTISFIERNEEWDNIAQREIEHLKVLFGGREVRPPPFFFIRQLPQEVYHAKSH